VETPPGASGEHAIGVLPGADHAIGALPGADHAIGALPGADHASTHLLGRLSVHDVMVGVEGAVLSAWSTRGVGAIRMAGVRIA